MTTHDMKPGDLLVLGDEAWNYDDLQSQLRLRRCASHVHHMLTEAEVNDLMAAWQDVKDLPPGRRGRERRLLAHRFGVSERTIHRYVRRESAA